LLKNAYGRLLLIRADGGPQIGFGHVMRSMAVAEEWLARGGRCVWATDQPRALDAAGSGRDDIEVVVLETESGGVDDSRATRRIAEECDADWVFADLFTFSQAYFSSAGARRAAWMIVHDEPLPVNERIDAILNPGPQAAPGFYPGKSARCGLLLGLEYALLRSELRQMGTIRGVRNNPPKKILVTFGGSDPYDLTGQTLRALRAGIVDTAVQWRVILGPGYRGQCPGGKDIFGDLNVEFVRYTSDMGRHYAWADLIICGASTTLWEALYFGTPAVVIPAATNQSGVHAALADCPAVKRFAAPDGDFSDWMSLLTTLGVAEKNWIQDASEAGRKMIDGGGVSRVVDFLLARK
jgi:spore coat polysaccharide biosynthesis predicted glycosyltransferase SpsG